MERRGVLSRRNFLKAGCAGLASWFLGGSVSRAVEIYYQTHRYDDALKIWLDLDNEGVSFEETARIAERFDRIARTFDYSPEVNEEWLQAWLPDILAAFDVIGAVDKVVVPTEITLDDFEDPDAHFSTLGSTVCNEGTTSLNKRTVRNERGLPTIIHELTHTQQGKRCKRGDREVEGTAQIVTWQMLAFLAVGGDPWTRDANRVQSSREAAYALILELRRVALRTALYEAIRTRRIEVFYDLVEIITPGALYAVMFDNHIDHFNGGMADLAYGLSIYAAYPLMRVIKAHLETENKIYSLALNLSRVKYIGGVSQPYVIEDPYFDIATLIKFIENAEGIISDFNKGV